MKRATRKIKDVAEMEENRYIKQNVNRENDEYQTHQTILSNNLKKGGGGGRVSSGDVTESEKVE